MAIAKADLMAALKSLSRDERRDLGLMVAHPFAPRDATPDRVKHAVGTERWYQLVRGDLAVELHISEQAGAVIHRYARAEMVAEPDYLLHGFVGVDGADTVAAPDLAAATDDDIWALLDRELQ